MLVIHTPFSSDTWLLFGSGVYIQPCTTTVTHLRRPVRIQHLHEMFRQI